MLYNTYHVIWLPGRIHNHLTADLSQRSGEHTNIFPVNTNVYWKEYIYRLVIA